MAASNSTSDQTTENISLAAEYAVASELCRRGLYAQLTFGNHKKTDILIEKQNGFLSVSVKAKRGPEWFRVTGIWQESDRLVFVDYKDKNPDQAPDYFILDVAAWKKVVKKIQKRKPGSALDKTNTLVWEPWGDRKKGWKGCSVKRSDVESYKDAWHTFGVAQPGAPADVSVAAARRQSRG